MAILNKMGECTMRFLRSPYQEKVNMRIIDINYVVSMEPSDERYRGAMHFFIKFIMTNSDVFTFEYPAREDRDEVIRQIIKESTL